jgi:membrane protein implicated in regulation of membrane protease activity
VGPDEITALIWLVVGVALLATETLSGEFVLAMLGGGALAAAAVALLVGGVVPSLVAFALVSVLLVFAVRPPLKRRLQHGVQDSLMHTRALVGAEALVVARVDGDGGRVRIGGELWSARPVHDDDVLDEGVTALVVEISGATAVVVAKD